MNYLETIPHRVAGIPCLIGVISHKSVKGSFNYNDVSDLDYYGYSDSQFHVLDRRGRRATWLEKKLNDREQQSVYESISNHLE
jgi:hypothetical protein